MLKFNGNRAIILKNNGDAMEYKVADGLMHHEILQKFCESMNYNTADEDTLVKNGHIYFRISDDTVICYLPESITEMQLYHLELLIPAMNELSYLGVIKNTSEGKKTYRYKYIILRLIAESLKEIKEINELISSETFSSEELIDLRSVILLEKKKISILKEHLKHKDEVETEEEVNNEIILVPSLTGNVKLIEDLEHIHPSNYEAFLELIESIKNGTFKGVKRFTNNMRFAGISEVRGFQVRIAFARIGKNKYALITAFTKKCDNDKGYRDSLTQKLSDYRLQEDKLKALAEDEEFLRENELNVERLYALLGKVEESTLKEVL